MTTCEFFNLTPAEQIDHARANQWRTHRATYPGILAEARRVTARLANTEAPTRRAVTNG